MPTSRLVAVVVLVLLGVTPGCGKKQSHGTKPEPSALPIAPVASGPSRPRGSVESPFAAVRAFREAWMQEIVQPSLTQTPRGKPYDSAVLESPYDADRVVRVRCRDGRDVGPSRWTTGADGDKYHLYGSLSSFDRDGWCWQVAFSDRLGNTVLGYVEIDTGSTLFVFWVPKG
jgi:hypothetical protein